MSETVIVMVAKIGSFLIGLETEELAEISFWLPCRKGIDLVLVKTFQWWISSFVIIAYGFRKVIIQAVDGVHWAWSVVESLDQSLPIAPLLAVPLPPLC